MSSLGTDCLKPFLLGMVLVAGALPLTLTGCGSSEPASVEEIKNDPTESENPDQEPLDEVKPSQLEL